MNYCILVGSNFDVLLETRLGLYNTGTWIVYSCDMKYTDETEYEYNNIMVYRVVFDIYTDAFANFFKTTCCAAKNIYILDGLSYTGPNDTILRYSYDVINQCHVGIHYMYYISPLYDYPTGNPSFLSTEFLLRDLEYIVQDNTLRVPESKVVLFRRNLFARIAQQALSHSNYDFLDMLDIPALTSEAKHAIRYAFFIQEIQYITDDRFQIID